MTSHIALCSLEAWCLPVVDIRPYQIISYQKWTLQTHLLNVCNPASVSWVCPVVSFQLDTPRTPLQGGVQEASWWDDQRSVDWNGPNSHFFLLHNWVRRCHNDVIRTSEWNRIRCLPYSSPEGKAASLWCSVSLPSIGINDSDNNSNKSTIDRYSGSNETV